MRFNPSHTELTSAATDAVIALLALACAAFLLRSSAHDAWKVYLWCCVFGLLAAGALLGAVMHGFAWSSRLRKFLWIPLFLVLGLTVSLFVVGVIYDWRGLSAARAAMPVLLALAVTFFGLAHFFSRSFRAFLFFETVAMLFALAVYVYLALDGVGGAMWLMALGVLLNIVGAAVQVTKSCSFTMIWRFDHNGAFHLMQMIALVVLTAGLSASLQTTGQPI